MTGERRILRAPYGRRNRVTARTGPTTVANHRAAAHGTKPHPATHWRISGVLGMCLVQAMFTLRLTGNPPRTNAVGLSVDGRVLAAHGPPSSRLIADELLARRVPYTLLRSIARSPHARAIPYCNRHAAASRPIAMHATSYSVCGADDRTSCILRSPVKRMGFL